MNKYKILHVVSVVAPRYGGSGITAQSIARFQANLGHSVTICTTNIDFPKGTLPVATGEPVCDDGVLKRYFEVQFRPLLVSIPLWRWLRVEIKHFDIVHIHGLYRFPVTYAAWRARRVGIPYIIRPHGSLDPFLFKQSRYSLLLKRIYERTFDIPNLHHATAIHYTTEEEAKLTAFLRLRAQPVIVPNGIDWESYKTLPPKGLFRKRLGLQERTPLVLFLGRINFKKGLDLLVPAFTLVLQEFPGARLAIVGPDNEGYGSKVRRWCAEKCIEDKVFFVDHLGSEKVQQAYVDADVFVLPSYTENFGLTVVEAMACRCPVVISDQVNIWREIQEEEAGLVVTLDVGEIAEAVCHLLAHKAEAKAMGARGRKVAETRYAWGHIVDQLTQVYREVIEDATAKRLSGG